MNAIKKLILLFLGIMIIGLLIPQNLIMPVEGASKSDYNQNSYWHYPWGKSVTHKGVDIFAKEGTNVLSSTSGLVIGAAQIGLGGNYVWYWDRNGEFIITHISNLLKLQNTYG